MKRLFVVFSCILIFSQSSVAQISTQSGLTGFRRGLATVMFAGLGGAILGLSTLSFYGEPQDHIGNIWVGLTVGALAGGAYAITQSQRNASLAALEYAPPQRPLAHRSVPVFQYTWQF